MDLEALRRVPKAELHLHLEGSLTPETLWRLAQRHGSRLGLNSLDDCKALYRLNGFAGFIHAIKTASQHLVEPADYAEAVRELALRLQGQGVVYAEVFLSLGILLWRGVPIEPYWEAIENERVRSEGATGVRMRWIFDAVRQFGPEPCRQVLHWALKLQPSGSVLGIGLGGDEGGCPAAAFVPIYAQAKAAGLHATVHAGETRGAESVREAVELLGAERIGHGLRSYEDPQVMDLLRDRGVQLDICLTSNRAIGIWPADRPHPARLFYDHGIRLAIASDDPGIFGCSLLGEYQALESQGFSSQELTGLAELSLSYGFSPALGGAPVSGLPGSAAADASGNRGMGIE